MIVHCWGTVNGDHIEFSPIQDKPGYWIGYAPWSPGLQDIAIWCENDRGAKGHLRCAIRIQYVDKAHTIAKLLLSPYSVGLYKGRWVAKFMTFDEGSLIVTKGGSVVQSVTFDFGETKRVSLFVRSLDRRPFEVDSATWSLMSGDEEESNGTCEIDEIRPTESIVSALINPMRPNSLYTLKITYSISEETFIEYIKVRVNAV